MPANTIIGSDATDSAPFYQQPGFWGLVTIVLVMATFLFCLWYFDRSQKRKREDRRNAKQESLARWKVVSDVARRYDPETKTLGGPGIYELKIVLETPKGTPLKAVELWRIDMTEENFRNDRYAKWDSASQMAIDLNSELDKPKPIDLRNLDL